MDGEPAEAAPEIPGVQIRMRQWNDTTSQGRPVALALPEDASEAEIAEIAVWILSDILAYHRAAAEAAKGPQLVIARGLPPQRPT